MDLASRRPAPGLAVISIAVTSTDPSEDATIDCRLCRKDLRGRKTGTGLAFDGDRVQSMGPARTKTLLTFLSAALWATPAASDEILLRGGGRVRGVIVERTKDAVVIETAPGRLTLPMRRIERIVESRSALEEFHERAAELAPGDAAGWATLARWAAERDLLTPSREAWRRVLAVDPSHPEANAALGRVELDGAWITEEEAYRARGYVEYEGRWVTPAEHEALVRERTAEEASARDSREAALRVREAEARAREAEARAREAEAAAQAPAEDGIPLWWGWGAGGVLPPVFPPPWEALPEPLPRETLPPPGPPSSTPPSSIGPTRPSDSGAESNPPTRAERRRPSRP